MTYITSLKIIHVEDCRHAFNGQFDKRFETSSVHERGRGVGLIILTGEAIDKCTTTVNIYQSSSTKYFNGICGLSTELGLND